MNNIFDRLVSSNTQHSHSTVTVAESNPAMTPDEGVKGLETRTPATVKQVTQELLKHGYIDEARKPELFRSAIGFEPEIQTTLEPLDLEMRLDAYRGVAFLVVAQTVYAPPDSDAAWLHPLVRRQRLTLEQSLLIALLRQAFVLHEQESGIGQGDAKMAIEDLLPQFLAYFTDSGSDAKNESRLLCLLDQLKPYGIVSEVDSKDEITIRPLIASLANPESLKALLETMKASAAEHESSGEDC